MERCRQDPKQAMERRRNTVDRADTGKVLQVSRGIRHSNRVDIGLHQVSRDTHRSKATDSSRATRLSNSMATVVSNSKVTRRSSRRDTSDAGNRMKLPAVLCSSATCGSVS